MAITQAMTTAFKGSILTAVHDFRSTGGDTFKIALYTSSASIDANSVAYTATNEVATGGNYTAGGNTLTGQSVTATNTSASAGTGWVDFADTTWTTATITARGAMIYNNTPSANNYANTLVANASVCVLDFGADKTSTAGDFTIVFPTPDSTNAIIRIS